MLEKIRGLELQGRCFTTKTKLNFFPNANDRLSIVYGKNGSGKSTISEGFFSLLLKDEESDITAAFLDENKNKIEIQNLAERISVFNERYIDENVKIQEDGLGTIVLFGGQVDLQAEIEKYEQLEKDSKGDLEKQQALYEQYTKSDNPLCPLYHKKRIEKVLKQPGGWAEIDSKIKGNRRNSSVTDEIIYKIGRASIKTTYSELKKTYDETEQLLAKVKTSSQVTYSDVIQKVKYSEGIEKRICKLLEKQIEEPVLTEREQLILLTIQNGKQYNVEGARETFSNSQVKNCPYCYQPVDEEYKHNLVESINRVLNKDVDNHKKELRDVSFPVIQQDYMDYSELDSDLVQKIILQVRKCDDIINVYRKITDSKMSNIYTSIKQNELGLGRNIDNLNVLLEQLESKRKEFNYATKRIQFLQQELIQLNLSMAHHNIIQNYKDYQKQIEGKKIQQKVLNDKEKIFLSITEKLKQFRERKANTSLAISSINNALNYVFFTNNRLSIELRDERYYLKSNGKDVIPKNVSLGERNIVALCYFFTQIMANQEISKMYKNEKLIIIDDPVSSFDFENKVGIMSFLRYQISRIITGNNYSKVLILSHDLTTVFDLKKAIEEICKSTKGDVHISTTSYSVLELFEKGLISFTKSRSEYGELLQMTYRYANGEAENNNITIGNSMRRVLEAFSTFTYKKSIQDVSCDKNVLKKLGEHSTYFENLMYRLVLHNESHYEEQIYNLHDNVNFYNFISDDEKKRTAKDVLCFMYFLNPAHVEAYLQTISRAIDNIKVWEKKIPLNSSFEITDISSGNSIKRSIPLYDLPLSAGTGQDIFDGEVPYSEYETENQRCDFALKILGDSMEPDIPNKSIVLIKKCNMLEDSKIGAFYHNGEVYCKKISTISGETYLFSLNEKYPPIHISLEDVLKVYGEVIDIEE